VTSRRLRPQGQLLVLVVLAVLLIVVAGLALVQKWQGAAWWIVGGAAGLAGFLGGAGPLWQRWREQRAAGAGVVRWSVSVTGKTIVDLSMEDLRVHTAVVDVPYLPRPVKEREVGDHLRARRPVLIVGPSMVGKTRLAAAAVGLVLPDKALLLPDTPTALLDLDKADIVVREQVIWLDDLERFLTGGGMTSGFMRRLCASNWLVATIRTYEWDRFQPTNQLRPPEWDVLRQFELVILSRDSDRPVDADLRRAIPDEELRRRIARTGIGEYVGAAQQVRDQLTMGEHANPVGYALVTGAADWSLVGITRPVPAHLLPRLAAARLTGRLRLELDDDEKFGAALKWATREINPTVSLLEPGDGTYSVYDYVLDQLATTNRTVPTATWQLAIDEAEDGELTSIGYQAFVHQNLPEIAEDAWRKAADRGNADAMFNLGVLLTERGEQAEAEQWYRKAVAGGTGDAGVMFNLGVLLTERGEQAEAEQWYRKAAERGQTRAMCNLGVLLTQRGEQAEAERWYRKAVAGGDGDAVVMRNLGVLLTQRGEQAEAEQWHRKAADAGLAGAMYSLSVLLTQRGEHVEAEHWELKAADAGSDNAMYSRGTRLAERGEHVEAEQWLRKAADADHVAAMISLALYPPEPGEQTEAEQ
jgi:TPR repeat protein